MMRISRIARAVAIFANAGILVALAFAGIVDPSRSRDVELGAFLAVTVLVLFLLLNIYIALARRDAGAFDETLIGLWIRTKKQKLRRELGEDED